MKKYFILIIFLFVQINVSAQNASDLPIQIRRVETEVAFDYVQEIVPDLISEIKKIGGDKTKAALRLCSNEPIQVALIKASLSFPSIVEVFLSNGFPKKDIIILKSSDCVSKTKDTVATEVWAIRSDANLPAYSERYVPDQISIQVIGDHSSKYIGTSSFIQNTKKLIAQMKKDKQNFGVVFGLFEHRAKPMKDKLEKITGSIKKNGFEKSRYRVELVKNEPQTSVIYVRRDPKYPVFYVVRIH